LVSWVHLHLRRPFGPTLHTGPLYTRMSDCKEGLLYIVRGVMLIGIGIQKTRACRHLRSAERGAGSLLHHLVIGQHDDLGRRHV
jgi:hypothetical protein